MLAEPLAVTLEVIGVLETLGVPYWIGGSLATALHGVARATLDTDLVAAMSREHIDYFARELEGSFYVDDEMIRGAIDHRSSFNLIHKNSMFQLN